MSEDPVIQKIEDLILQVDEVLGGAGLKDEQAEAVQELRREMVAIVHPESRHWGWWDHRVQHSPDPQLVENRMHIVEIPAVDGSDLNIEVCFYKGQTDGKPVIQIDGRGDFRVNINDGAIWDQSTEEPRKD